MFLYSLKVIFCTEGNLQISHILVKKMLHCLLSMWTSGILIFIKYMHV